MEIKKLAIAVGVSVCAMASGLAHANNVITFNGEVVETTCEPVANNGDYTVVLDQVAASALTAVGQYDAISAPFSIQVQNCPVTATAVGAVLASSTYDAASGNLTDVAGYGSDAVQIQVMDGTAPTTQVVVGDTTPVTYVPTVNNAATIPMMAYYYVKDTAGVVPGLISTTATYALRTQ
ncbi:fimbrial protein [Paraburkholderia dinghuensis]|uniref:Type 1 fimbrial protein n=1 Tax=Paraburkholderia dinghuensis TaxID=2305225 RepID=A0A3N6PXK1_9BURK|nr:fimbrial protein [Paraburkholderia dinghuensis]RQH07120.1 type 1 fimbrial protein [Paraburkholderia dinghuensis]